MHIQTDLEQRLTDSINKLRRTAEYLDNKDLFMLTTMIEGKYHELLPEWKARWKELENS